VQLFVDIGTMVGLRDIFAHWRVALSDGQKLIRPLSIIRAPALDGNSPKDPQPELTSECLPEGQTSRFNLNR
jgi:hypothetical protein